MLKKILLPPIVAVLLFSACGKKTEDFTLTPISEYAPMEVGKYITYQLDSFRYLPFLLTGVTISMQAKFMVDAAITDNLGRPAYRIVRYTRENTGDEWSPGVTFMATNTGSSFEFVDNNLRFEKLTLPIQNGYSWKGNAYINTVSQYTDFAYLDDWDYTYDSVGAPLTLGAITLDNTLKVAQRDDVVGNPDDPNSYSQIDYGVEYYAKGIGLVYKKLFHSEYQPPTSAGGTGYYSDDTRGYTLTMIDHN